MEVGLDCVCRWVWTVYGGGFGLCMCVFMCVYVSFYVYVCIYVCVCVCVTLRRLRRLHHAHLNGTRVCEEITNALFCRSVSICTYTCV